MHENAEISVTVSAHEDLQDLSWNSSGLKEYGHHLLALSHESQLLGVHEDDRTLFTRINPLAYEQSEEVSDSRLGSPMPGNVIHLLVKVVDELSSGQPLLVMEEMKIEYTLLLLLQMELWKKFFFGSETFCKMTQSWSNYHCFKNKLFSSLAFIKLYA